MTGAPEAEPARHRSPGFALIIVLWTLVLLAFITAHLAGSGRVELRIAGNLASNSVAGAAADGAVWRAVFELLESDPNKRWPPDGSLHRFMVGDSRVVVRVYDEDARINPNFASPGLLAALLAVTGSAPETASRLAAAIGVWVGKAGTASKPQALTAAYDGRGYAPPGEPLETLGELRRINGMSPRIFAAIRPHLSLFAPAVPDAAYADPVVKAAIAAIAGPQAARAAPASRRSDMLTARIVANAEGPGNARATRTAIVRVIPKSGFYAVLAWNSEGDG
ncbi:MAG TPA: hypothetical protein VFX06_06415 [Stellaceae bacterium]|nr:hypothetical protein [Stellaceae bacterium]